MLRQSLRKPKSMEVAMRRRHTLIGAAVGLVCLFGLAAKSASQNPPSDTKPAAATMGDERHDY
jgi:Spy/CpxP family protein refolding chaperone